MGGLWRKTISVGTQSGGHSNLCLEGGLLLRCAPPGAWPVLRGFSHIRLCVTAWTAAYQAPLSWDAPGKNTRVGCHALL